MEVLEVVVHLYYQYFMNYRLGNTIAELSDLYWDYGGIDNDIHQVSDNPNDSDKLIKLYDESDIFSLTGDLTRRTWNTIKAVITGNNDAKVECG